MKVKTALFLSIILLSPISVHAQIGADTSPDPQVRRNLEEEGLKYEVDSDGDFRLVIEVSDTRTQLVWVSSSTSEALGREIRRVFSLVYSQEADRPVSDRIAHWALEKQPTAGSLMASGNGRVYFVLKIDANASSDFLATSIYGVAGIADEYEREQGSGDDL